MKKEYISKSIQKGLYFLSTSQELSGNFIGESFTEDGITERVATVFDTAFILSSLVPLREDRVCENITGRGLHFLTNQKSVYGSYNYWQKNSIHKKNLPYPDDLDDTALALTAQILFGNKEDNEGELFANIVNLLIQAETETGGPYNTWLCDYKQDTRWLDVDIGVNANIAYMLSLLNVNLPNLEHFFDLKIEKGELTSKYYTSKITLVYLITRSYRGKNKDMLVKILLDAQNKDSSWNSPLTTSLAVSSLIYLGAEKEDFEKSVEYILNQQEASGAWKREPLYLDPSDTKHVWHHGSESLTTAVCLEALTLSQNILSGQTKDSKIEKYGTERKLVVKMFLESVKNESDIFFKPAHAYIEKITKSSISHDSLIMSFIGKEMLGDCTQHIQDETLYILSEANLAGWIGYTILDDILDGDTDCSLLPFASWCIRHTESYYQKILDVKSFEVVQKILSKAEEALYLEHQTHLSVIQNGYTKNTLRDNKKIEIYTKSFGSALPILTLLLMTKESPNGLLFTQVTEFWQHYLTAYQMHDDSHDFIEDIQKCQVTPVIHMILQHLQEDFSSLTKIEEPKETRKIQKLFWEKVFPEVNMQVEKHIQKCRNILDSLPFKDTGYFLKLIQNLTDAQNKAHNERLKIIHFIKKI